MSEKMTIHRALSELKLIDSKIEKQIQELIPTGVKQKDKLVSGNVDEEEFKKAAQSKFDSVNALIARKMQIKSAVVAVNGIQTLKVAGKEMTIAEAINYKASIAHKKVLINTLKTRYNQTLAALNKGNELAAQNVQAILEATFGKENVKVTKDDMEAVRKPYLEANEFHLVDPLKVVDTIEKLEKEVLEFEADVDASLSEINAVTFVEI